MLKDYKFDDDDYKPDELQNDDVVMLKGIQLAVEEAAPVSLLLLSVHRYNA